MSIYIADFFFAKSGQANFFQSEAKNINEGRKTWEKVRYAKSAGGFQVTTEMSADDELASFYQNVIDAVVIDAETEPQ